MFSIVMSVYNGERHLAESIESILCQTFTDFEFIIINDGSTDKTQNILDYYDEIDTRIKVISRDNRGLIFSLNEGIEYARNEYIVRMDADDIAHEHRLRYLSDELKNKDVDIVSSRVEIIDVDSKFVCESPLISDINIEIEKIPFLNPIYHPTVCFKKSAYLSSGRYSDCDYGVEDVMLWKRMRNNKKTFSFINTVSLKYRINPVSVRGVRVDKYDYTLAVACLSCGAKRDAFKYLGRLKIADLSKIILGLLLPYTVFSWYMTFCGKRKIKNTHPN